MSENPIDPRNNPESQVNEGDASQTSSWASETSDGGAPPAEAPKAGQTPAEQDAADGTPGGTGQGNPLAGVLISEEDAAEAVPGDTGPEHPGARRDSRGGPA